MSDTDPLLVLAMAASTFVGALAQRSTGMGFALLSAPFLVLVLGPLQGILVVNAASCVASALILVQVWRDIEWSRAAVLVPMGALGVIPGAVAVALLPEAPLTGLSVHDLSVSFADAPRPGAPEMASGVDPRTRSGIELGFVTGGELSRVRVSGADGEVVTAGSCTELALDVRGTDDRHV